jgi:hypothetical protein
MSNKEKINLLIQQVGLLSVRLQKSREALNAFEKQRTLLHEEYSEAYQLLGQKESELLTVIKSGE